MKTTALLAILAIGATSVNAAALAGVESEARWCTLKGQPCWKVRRTAEAFSDAIVAARGLPGDASDSAIARRSNAPGGLADNAKRSLDDLAGIIASTFGSPYAYYSSLDLSDAFPEEPETSKREAEPEAEPSVESEARWCLFKGQPCWKVKRAAEAVVSTIEGFGHAESKRSFEPLVVGKREANPAPEPEAKAVAEAEPWCRFKGQPCWKRSAATVEARCHAPGGACASARRDLHGIYNAARQVLDSLPAQ